jgi:glyceraldehyde-3-phosphate dehydrogenase (NAD(P))
MYNEAIVVPENVNATRALTGIVEEGAASMRITDEAMGMRKEFLI